MKPPVCLATGYEQPDGWYASAVGPVVHAALRPQPFDIDLGIDRQ